jgi:DNA-binding GntR family transcriptional regulator
MLDHISQYNDLPRSLEPESYLGEKFGVSRSTIRKIINNLPARVLKIDGRSKIIIKRPLKKDYYILKGEELSKSDIVENLFLNKLSNNDLEPGAQFSELQLAKEFGCTTGTVREVLIKVRQLGIIQKEPRLKWRMISFTDQMIDELYQMRELLETSAVQHIISLPLQNEIWDRLSGLINEHLDLQSRPQEHQEELPDLDKKFHFTLLEACENRYFTNSFIMISMIIHYQRKFNGLTQKVCSLAIKQHLKIARCLIKKDKEAALAALLIHLKTGRKLMKADNNGFKE